MIVEDVKPGVTKYKMMPDDKDLYPIVRKRGSYKRLTKTDEELLAFLTEQKTVIQVCEFCDAGQETVRYHLRKLVASGKVSQTSLSGPSGTYFMYMTVNEQKN